MKDKWEAGKPIKRAQKPQMTEEEKNSYCKKCTGRGSIRCDACDFYKK